uniref:Phospholipase A2-like central domain-containing protein n=1 Tax=Denticeps clupeoides TaxID=299321 RepID=A0AAY4B3Q6_9TELE
GALADPVGSEERGFTYPGTLWCGAGNIADSYEQLGEEFAETDRCCRVHDHCPHVVHAFSSNYGYTNSSGTPSATATADNQCLRTVNDTASRVVGQAFFNVIEVPCFRFSYEEQVCGASLVRRVSIACPLRARRPSVSHVSRCPPLSV